MRDLQMKKIFNLSIFLLGVGVSSFASAGLYTISIINSTKYPADIRVSFHDSCPDINVNLKPWSSDYNVSYEQGCILHSINGILNEGGVEKPIKSPYVGGGTSYTNFAVLNDKNDDSKIVEFVYGVNESDSNINK